MEHTPGLVQWLRIDELARSLGVSRSKIYDWIARFGFPKPIRISPNIAAWLVEDVAKWQRQVIAAEYERTPTPHSPGRPPKKRGRPRKHPLPEPATPKRRRQESRAA